MSSTAKEINKITGTIIRVSLKLILYIVLIWLLVQVVHGGFRFGYAIFTPYTVDEAPGRDVEIVVAKGQSKWETVEQLEDMGLILDKYAAFFQMYFYDYEVYPGVYEANTSLTAKEILQILNVEPEETETGETASENDISAQSEAALSESVQAPAGEIQVQQTQEAEISIQPGGQS